MKVDRKSAILLQCGHFDPQCQVEGDVPTIIFARIVMPMNALNFVAESFHTKKVCSRRFNRSAILNQKKRPLCVLEPPFGGLETMYSVHLGLIAKAEALLANIG